MAGFGKSMFFDTHCHLDDPLLHGRLAEVLDRAVKADIGTIVIPAVGPEGWELIAGLARPPHILPAFGVHPMRAADLDAEAAGRLRSLLDRARAVGEIGLDYTLAVPRELQRRVFRAQLELAVDAGLPVLIHCRKAFADTLSMLRDTGVIRGVMHSFSGSLESALEFVRLGLFISVSGTVTWKNAVRPVEVARGVPLESLLLETDAPDLAPEPFRGGGNEPANIVEVARRVAEIRGISVEEVAEATTANARRLFGV